MVMSALKHYYSLTKPGIVYGNAITAIAGFLFASRGDINYALLCAMTIGISLVMASGCVLNNYIDRDIDALMERTQQRVLVRGLISDRNALLFGACLGIIGVGVLISYVNLLAASIAFAGLVVYVGIYSLWAKRHSIYGTLVGSIAGAVPPVVGYCAVANHLDYAVVILFFVLCVWQMPHSYAIALYRLNDYRTARIPVLPVVKGIHTAKVHMVAYTIVFIVVASLLTFFDYAGYGYLAAMVILGGAWLGVSLRGFRATDNTVWARTAFLFSLVVLLGFCFAIALVGIA
jgi:protoheme IX farnesyltransferase